MKVRLLVVQGKPAGKTLHFGLGEFYLGRGPECHVRFNSDWVSRQHCLLRVSPSLVHLRDLSSRNGTLVNGQLIEDHVLKSGDLIQIGPVVLEVGWDTPVPDLNGDGVRKPVLQGANQDSKHLPSQEPTAPHPPLDS